MATKRFALLLSALLIVPPAASQVGDSARPRALVDSTFAVRLAVAVLAERIRQGDSSSRERPDLALSTAIVQLTRAASAARPAAPQRGLGRLWDFQFDSLRVQRAEGAPVPGPVAMGSSNRVNLLRC